MPSSTYLIQGMTCESCVRTVTERASALPGVTLAEVSLEKGTITLTAPRPVALAEVRGALADLPKYTVLDPAVAPAERPKSFLRTYRPLLTVFAFILLASTAHQIRLGSFEPHVFMNHVMAGFFIGLSFFKFLDLPAFARSFSGYDPLARAWAGYGYAYPFVELALGLLYLSGVALVAANVATILALAITTAGVYRRLRAPGRFECACLGATFDLPLSSVTIAENAAMIAMAAYGLFSAWV